MCSDVNGFYEIDQSILLVQLTAQIDGHAVGPARPGEPACAGAKWFVSGSHTGISRGCPLNLVASLSAPL
jgi:hypothetical protein